MVVIVLTTCAIDMAMALMRLAFGSLKLVEGVVQGLVLTTYRWGYIILMPLFGFSGGCFWRLHLPNPW